MDWSDIARDSWQTSLVFVTLLIFTRVLGKTQVGQLTFYEYINGITIGSIAGSVVASEADKVWNHFYDLLLFVIFTYFISYITMKSRSLRKIIEGSPEIVIENGRILIDNMRGMRFDLDELNGMLREKGYLDPAEIQYAILETSGVLSVIPKCDYQPLTKSDLNIHLPGPTLPIELIMDGEIIEENLQKQNYSRDWLDKQLAERNLSDVSQITYAAIDSKGNLFISEKITNGAK